MNGIENILKRIESDTAAEIAEIQAKCEADCEQVRNRYREEAKNAYWKVITAGKQEADAHEQRLCGLAETEAKKQMLALKQEMIERAFALAADKLTSLPEDQYVALLASLAQRASSTGSEELIFSPSDRARYGKRVAKAANEALEAAGKTGALRLSERTRNMRGGLIVQNGKIEVNCSIETMLSMRRNELAGAVAERLFL